MNSSTCAVLPSSTWLGPIVFAESCRAIATQETHSCEPRKPFLIVAMLTRLGRRGYAVGEEAPAYRTQAIDPDADPDADFDAAVGGSAGRCRGEV